ncbi:MULTISPECIES: hypothetical protein [unclassified Paenibacillus]|uniref:hypothetical protein n=1 Tax=unclassified Paenibacillus TaxID=185978 RepID=UPI001AE274BB|nr:MULTISPECIES: hypothetical protein [unclassified Paenibacillus]MBP1155886.1 hypothetical protein [Paenibacillus sp. PvP091]MBP1168728.1 hypothetical protein [Paenibacillus sp. PvR098]MBP2439756.1 hypothetical protein [Paenibacillus sp. PvP052]
MSTTSSGSTLPENEMFIEMLGQHILIVTKSAQLNILGQTFRGIFTGKLCHVADGYITLDPVIIKMFNAPFYRFPTPLQYPIEQIANFMPFDPETRLPLT